MPITITVNGQSHSLDVEPDTPLLWAIRDTLGLTGTKFGCGISACGACTVHVNGRAVRSCTLPVSAVEGAAVTTIEGLAEDGALHKVQQAWIEHQVPQCGYCQSGMIMAVAALLARHPHRPMRRSTPRSPISAAAARSRGSRRAIHAIATASEGRRVMGKWTRRAFIGTGTLVGGGFVLGVAGVALSPSRHSVVSDDAAETGELNTWITVTPDNLVTVLVPHCEMGQGAQTALAMMAAEEMEAEWDLVRVKEAPALDAYANAYILRAFTGDSIPAPFERAFDYGTYRLARMVRTAGDRRLHRPCAAPDAMACASPARRPGRC